MRDFKSPSNKDMASATATAVDLRPRYWQSRYTSRCTYSVAYDVLPMTYSAVRAVTAEVVPAIHSKRVPPISLQPTWKIPSDGMAFTGKANCFETQLATKSKKMELPCPAPGSRTARADLPAAIGAYR